MFENFECDKCGACCKSFIVEAYDYDWMREPKLKTQDAGRRKPKPLPFPDATLATWAQFPKELWENERAVRVAYYKHFGSRPQDAELSKLKDAVDAYKRRQATPEVIILAVPGKPCPFLAAETQECEIYPTRPVCCVMVQAGDAKCQQARARQGIPILRDKEGRKPTMQMMVASCRDYDLAITEIYQH